MEQKDKVQNDYGAEQIQVLEGVEHKTLKKGRILYCRPGIQNEFKSFCLTSG